MNNVRPAMSPAWRRRRHEGAQETAGGWIGIRRTGV